MKAWGRTASQRARGVAIGAAALTGLGLVVVPASAASASSAVPRCRQGGASLRVSLGESDGAAGSIFVPIKFRNLTSHSCYLDGHPGVSYVGARGGQIGHPAIRTDSARYVVLKPGGTATATLRVVQYLNFPNCNVARVNGLRIYPPGSTGSDFIAWAGKTCTNQQILSIDAVH
jgi:uncharacterized protein DUF4232